MKLRNFSWIAALPLISVLCRAGETVVLKEGGLSVAMDAEFPRIIACRLPAGDVPGNPAAASVVQLNGSPTPCKIVATRKSENTLVYQLSFSTERISLDLVVTALPDGIRMEPHNLKEAGTVKLNTLAFPDNPLLTISTKSPDASIAACLATNVNDQFGTTFRERISPVAVLKAGYHDTGNYLFLSAGGVACGIASDNFTDIHRTEWKITEADGVKTCAAGVPVWEFRKFDDEKPDLPAVHVFVTPDLNGDGKADWQDAAIVYRRTMPKPLGSDKVRTTVGENIAMNFASGAQQPFLKILDEIKRIHLATDGLGNQVIIKGFSSEGHDSANTDYADHWNERAGGLKDLNVLLENAGKYNTRVGIHINATEAYPEAQRYKPEILRKDANGNYKGGWSWLDNAVMLDKEADVRSGQLFTALDRMRAALPKLDFVYVDTYWENGWPAAKTARKINSLGLPMYSEGDSCLDPWIAWGHWRGTKHTIQRFLWFSDRDLFGNDAILRGGRADTDGFMGWQNQHHFTNSIRNTFTNRLPGKFLQHFELMRWVPGESAEFDGGLKVVKTGEQVAVTQYGKPLMSWTGGGAKPELFVPWPPRAPEKCYVWSDAGGSKTFDLPDSWGDVKEVWLYQLGDLGRSTETPVPVTGRRVTLDVAKSAAFVVYPKKAPASAPMAWGEGGPVKDPGFDSRGFTDWKLEGNAVVEPDGNGNPRLVMASGAASVAQTISGLQSGKTYAATVWAQAKGGRSAAIEVNAEGKVFRSESVLFNVKHSAPNDSRTGTFYQRLRVVFPAPSSSVTLSMKGGAGEGSVEFDDVRVVETAVSPEAAKHTFWEDFEHVESGGYGPFTCCPGERTHLSESNPPYTKDTIRGKFSLKSRDNGQVARTIPSSLRLKPATKYRVAFASMGNGRLTAVSGGGTVATLRFQNLPDFAASNTSGEFITKRDTESYLALHRDGGDFIVIDDLAVDEIGPASEAEMAAVVATSLIPDETPKGMKLLLEEKFAKPLGADWKLTPSKLPGTSITSKDGALALDAYANTSLCVDLVRLPDSLTAVQVQVSVDGATGETWGPGLALVWPGGQQLRVNLRAPDHFGVDSTAAAQKITGKLNGGSALLRIRIEDLQVVVEAICSDDSAWQKLAEFPRDKFTGKPSLVRLGKSHAVEALDDHTDIGAVGTTRFTSLKLFGK